MNVILFNQKQTTIDMSIIPPGPMHITMERCEPSIQTFWKNMEIICKHGADRYSCAALAYWYFPENADKTPVDFENELSERGFTNFYLGSREFNEDEEDDIEIGDYVPIKARYHLFYLWDDITEFSLTDVAEEHKADRCLTFRCTPPQMLFLAQPEKDPLIINAGIVNAVPDRVEGWDKHASDLAMLSRCINKLVIREVTQQMMRESFDKAMNRDDSTVVAVQDKDNEHGDVLIVRDKYDNNCRQYGFQQLRDQQYGFYILATDY